MPKVTTVGGWSQGTDAGFRAWVAEAEQMLEDCGLVRTADTGQINTATVVRPAGANSKAGYSMWRFNDSLQATVPIFFRIDYGTGQSQTVPSMWLRVGTGSDGTGSLTGMVSAEVQNGISSGPGAAPDYRSFALHREGSVFLAFKVNGTSSSGQYGTSITFSIQRTVDENGDPTGEGLLAIVPDAQGYNLNYGRLTWMRFGGSPYVRPAWVAQPPCVIPYDHADSRVDGFSPQVFLHWLMLPRMLPMLATASYYQGEVALFAEKQLALVGPTPRTYLFLDWIFDRTASVYGNSLIRAGTCVLWED